MIEFLEARRLFSFTLVKGTLSISGTHQSDVIEVRDAGFIDGVIKARIRVNKQVDLVPMARVGRIIVHGGDGHDRIQISVPRACTIVGGSGNDRLVGGGAGSVIKGDTGNDQISVGGRCTIYGGEGNDLISDSVAIFPLPPGFFFDRGPTTGPALIYGGPGNDTIKGTVDSDTIYGGGGDDLITELARSPLISAPGTKPPVQRGDLIFGENGSDTIKGAIGDDTLDGGNGSDLLIDHYGMDTFRNGPGHDTVLAAGYDDRIYVGPGEDHVVANDLP